MVSWKRLSESTLSGSSEFKTIAGCKYSRTWFISSRRKWLTVSGLLQESQTRSRVDISVLTTVGVRATAAGPRDYIVSAGRSDERRAGGLWLVRPAVWHCAKPCRAARRTSMSRFCNVSQSAAPVLRSTSGHVISIANRNRRCRPLAPHATKYLWSLPIAIY